uniref:Uncharacterized protein n=1 Tax=Nelumbo nucifera TaxID=4432 RepID=A0A822Z6F1_NELNU|nr:TPA_asm: hypothetical protein HUJ06_012868 [Nelumbo nucifera]
MIFFLVSQPLTDLPNSSSSSPFEQD